MNNSTPNNQKPTRGDCAPADPSTYGQSSASPSDRLEPDGGTGYDRESVQRLHQTIEEFAGRLEKLEQGRTRGRAVIGVLLLVLGYFTFDYFFPDGVVVQQTLMESTEIKLVDNDGNPKLFLRMFSRVPVLQLMGEDGTPRMSLGLRFDNTPFIDLSDNTGQTRATFEMTSDDTPLIQFYDENGEKTTRLN